MSIRWTNYPGEKLIEKAEIMVDGQLLQCIRYCNECGKLFSVLDKEVVCDDCVKMCCECDCNERVTKKCMVCNDSICELCYGKTFINKNEWLQVGRVCDNKNCKNVCCVNCITTCYDCCNEGKDYPSYCMNCQETLVKVDCKYHDRYTCGQHLYAFNDIQTNCGECFANYNYSKRYQ